MTAAADLYSGFESRLATLGDVALFTRIGGKGPPLLLLHGYPQTHVLWHRVAPALAAHFTLIIPDLRGYGASSCPPSDGEHRAYAKRTMALDVLRLMASLGHTRFSVMGHDRGARVAYRLALDHPAAVERLVAIDILTTFDQWQPGQQLTRRRIFHWAFLAQPAPIPETLIGTNPVDWLEGRFRRGTMARSTDPIDPRAMAHYRASLSDPDRVHATCEDYRASASCDLADDTDDRVAGRQIVAPTLVIWGSQGSLAEVGDPLAFWKPWCRSVEGILVEAGHYIPEENPTALLAAALPFLICDTKVIPP
ncbi:MAG: alpha/beta hydrolase [Hyphomicrobiaceae bacterium]|nr:alpha/beta hydrolase [Hyphomicrobiaceae bacterium]